MNQSHPVSTATVGVHKRMDHLLACPYCDLIHQRIIQPVGKKALCTRCGGLLYRRRDKGVEIGLALVISCLILFLVVNLSPLLSLEMNGIRQETTLLGGIIAFAERDDWLLAILVLFTLILFPLFRFSGLLYVLYPLRLGRVPPHAARIFRWCHNSSPWGMLEIFLLAGLIAAVKLEDSGTVLLGLAAYAFVALILVSAWADYIIEPSDIWARIGTQGV